jgi:hypothetical protein
MRTINDFPEILLCDFEYHHAGLDEGPSVPVCGCALELRSGKEYRLWTDQLSGPKPPWRHDRDTLFVAYNATAELGCHAALGWPFPSFILDLLIEFRWLVNGDLNKYAPRKLPDALAYFKLPSIGAEEKDLWQKLVLTGGPFDKEQREGILRYCWSDVEALRLLLPAILQKIPRDLDRALFRGRYTHAATWSMRSGVPIDELTWQRILSCRDGIQQRITANCPLYDSAGTFKHDRFTRWIEELGLLPMWPRTECGQLSTDNDTLKNWKYVPEIARFRQIHQTVNLLDKPSFSVHHGRNHYGLLPFASESSRNATTRCIVQAPTWTKPIIQAPPGYGLIHADWSQEEFGVAAVLSNDLAAIQTYETGDSYIAFAVLAGLVPLDATKTSHPVERDLCKTMTLATQYGQGSRSLAVKLGRSQNYAEDLLRAHRRAFRRLWRWMDDHIGSARWNKKQETLFGWRLIVKPETKSLTCRNFPVQANAAEILRIAHLFLCESGIRVCVPVHDAFIILALEKDLEDVAEVVRRQMMRASGIVLHGFELRADTQILVHPKRLIDRRGERMWEYVLKTTDRLLSQSYIPPCPPCPPSYIQDRPNIREEKNKKEEKRILHTKPITEGVR